MKEFYLIHPKEKKGGRIRYMRTNKKVLVIHPYFFPAWKAGGPVQSLNNMVTVIAGKLDVYVITSGYELQETKVLKNIQLKKWNGVKGAKVRYLQNKEQTPFRIKEVIQEVQPDVIYVNGLYSMAYVIYPLLIWKLFFKKGCRLILSPRGMLQEGALKVKPVKKKVFLLIFKFLRLDNGIEWHATDHQESEDIKKQFGKSALVHQVPNIPKMPLLTPAFIQKERGEVRIIYLSLITEKKNLLAALHWLKELKHPAIFDIYGPLKDKDYWEKCEQVIEQMPGEIKVKYKGEVSPEKVQEMISRYHCLLLPTKGENFGHAIYESFSVGRPVIISNNTPWKDLKGKEAGFIIDLNNKDSFFTALKKLYEMDETEFWVMCKNALKIASDYWNQYDFESEYAGLFSHSVHHKRLKDADMKTF